MGVGDPVKLTHTTAPNSTITTFLLSTRKTEVSVPPSLPQSPEHGDDKHVQQSLKICRDGEIRGGPGKHHHQHTTGHMSADHTQPSPPLTTTTCAQSPGSQGQPQRSRGKR